MRRISGCVFKIRESPHRRQVSYRYLPKYEYIYYIVKIIGGKKPKEHGMSKVVFGTSGNLTHSAVSLLLTLQEEERRAELLLQEGKYVCVWCSKSFR